MHGNGHPHSGEEVTTLVVETGIEGGPTRGSLTWEKSLLNTAGSHSPSPRCSVSGSPDTPHSLFHILITIKHRTIADDKNNRTVSRYPMMQSPLKMTD